MENIPEQFAQLKELLTEYFDSNLEYYKFSSFEKLIRFAIAISLTALFLLLAMFALLFFGFGTAVWLSDVLGNEILGYMGTGTIYLVLIFLIYLLKKPLIERPLIKLCYRILYTKKDKD
ncbi:hypothetical protein [Ancylomarina sp.]|uniref:hypothetical protein n=1 Tax=Ancylomarina sp. TaxID=1970196 RepID=UPI00356A2854